MNKYFPKLKFSWGRVQVEFRFPNYATKVDLKNTGAVDTSKFAEKFNLASLKPEVFKLDIYKLENVPGLR